MSFVSSKDMLQKAQKNKYAVGAFNAENMEMVQAIIAAAEELCSPVIIQTTPSTLKYASPYVFAGMVSRMAEYSYAPIALHLDHGNSYELARECVEQGYTSIMIDGSLLSFEDNIVLTRKVVEMAGDVPVEAELGTVGGKEDSHSANINYTDPYQAEEFVRRTGITSFAPAIGTAHGVYKAEPHLDLKRLGDIASRVNIPLVLHGTSGVPENTVRDCIMLGICKVNYATDLRVAFTDSIKKTTMEYDNIIDPKKVLAPARNAVKERVRALIHLCGSEGKA